MDQISESFREQDLQKLRSFNVPRFYVLALIFVGVAMFGLGICVGWFKFSTIKQSTQQVSQSTPLSFDSSKMSKALTFNLNAGPETLNFSKAQVIVPSSYFGTSDDMITAYNSQGGMAPPLLILTKNFQVGGESGIRQEYGFREVIADPANICIAIWSTMGFSSIDEWTSSILFTGELKQEGKISVGKRSVDIYKLTRNEGTIYVGFLDLKNKDRKSYFFNTCNTHNKEDFFGVISSLKFRDDLD